MDDYCLLIFFNCLIEITGSFPFQILGPAGVTELNGGANSLLVYHDKANEELLISLNDNNDVLKEVKIFNALGELLNSTQVSSGSASFNTSGYSSGVYFISVLTASGKIINSKALVF